MWQKSHHTAVKTFTKSIIVIYMVAIFTCFRYVAQLYGPTLFSGLDSRTGLGKIAHNTVTPILESSHPFR